MMAVTSQFISKVLHLTLLSWLMNCWLWRRVSSMYKLLLMGVFWLCYRLQKEHYVTAIMNT